MRSIACLAATWLAVARAFPVTELALDTAQLARLQNGTQASDPPPQLH